MCQFFFSVGFVIYLSLYRPLETRFSNNMAVLDEVVITFVLYVLMHFTDYQTDPYLRSDFGVAYITILCVFTGIHMVFIIFELAHSLKLRIMYAWHWRH